MKKVRTYVMLTLGMALFGSATPLSKLVTQDIPVFIAGGLRVLLAFIVLVPFVKLSNIRAYNGKNAWLLAGISLIGVVGFTVLMLFGMQQISGVTGSIIMSATPALTAGLSVIIFKDSFNWKKGIALLLAVSGVVVMQLGNTSATEGKNEFWGIILVVLAICCEAAYTLMGKALTKEYPPEEIATFSAILGFIGFVPFLIWQFHSFSFTAVPVKSWLFLAFYGAGTMGLGSLLWYKGIQKVDGSTAATFMGVMPVSALLLSYVLLGESFQWVQLIGFGLVFSGVLLIISVHRKMKMEKM